MSSTILEQALPQDDGKIFWDTKKQLAEEKHGPEKFEKENRKERMNNMKNLNLGEIKFINIDNNEIIQNGLIEYFQESIKNVNDMIINHEEDWRYYMDSYNIALPDMKKLYPYEYLNHEDYMELQSASFYDNPPKEWTDIINKLKNLKNELEQKLKVIK